MYQSVNDCFVQNIYAMREIRGLIYWVFVYGGAETGAKNQEP